MSKANKAVKVLRTAHKRITKGWSANSWVEKTEERDPDTGKRIFKVCLEGSVYGFCNLNVQPSKRTKAHEDALRLIREAIYDMMVEGKIPFERYIYLQQGHVQGDIVKMLENFDSDSIQIPAVNDRLITKDQAMEIVKRAIIKAETGALDDPEDDYIDPDEVTDILSGAMP